MDRKTEQQIKDLEAEILKLEAAGRTDRKDAVEILQQVKTLKEAIVTDQHDQLIWQLASTNGFLHQFSQCCNDDAIRKLYGTIFPPFREQNIIFFWHEYEENGAFSNWYPSEFCVFGVKYCCCEQYLMAQKAALFNDSSVQDRIMRSNDPQTMKNLGRTVSPFDAGIWNENRFRIMVEGLSAKFTQNESLKMMLLSTGDALLAEASPYDRTWGIGLESSDPLALDPRNWNGMNLLGKALVLVREQIREH